MEPPWPESARSMSPASEGARFESSELVCL